MLWGGGIQIHEKCTNVIVERPLNDNNLVFAWIVSMVWAATFTAFVEKSELLLTTFSRFFKGIQFPNLWSILKLLRRLQLDGLKFQGEREDR